MCSVSLSFSLYLSVFPSGVSHSWARLCRTTDPSFLCFVVVGAFSLQQGLQQSHSTSQSSSSFGGGAQPQLLPTIYSSHLHPCLKQPPSACKPFLAIQNPCPQHMQPTYQQEPDDQEILFVFLAWDPKKPSRSMHQERTGGAFKIHESIWWVFLALMGVAGSRNFPITAEEASQWDRIHFFLGAGVVSNLESVFWGSDPFIIRNLQHLCLDPAL